MNWLKIITKSGRQSLARELLTENLTADTITKWAATGTNTLLEKIQDKGKLETIAANVARASTLVAALSDAVKDGEVSADEAATIRSCIYDLVGSAITQEQIASLIDRIVKKIP